MMWETNERLDLVLDLMYLVNALELTLLFIKLFYWRKER